MKIRLNFMLWLYGWSQTFYAQYFKRKKKSWGITKSELMHFPDGSLGKALGEFYYKNGFDVMPKLENHDVFHILTETGTQIQDEIAMQFLLCGNGKLSLYMFSMMGIGTLVYPEFIRYYFSHYIKGKSMGKFHDLEFQYYLDRSLIFLRASVKTGQFFTL